MRGCINLGKAFDRNRSSLIGEEATEEGNDLEERKSSTCNADIFANVVFKPASKGNRGVGLTVRVGRKRSLTRDVAAGGPRTSRYIWIVV